MPLPGLPSCPGTEHTGWVRDTQKNKLSFCPNHSPTLVPYVCVQHPQQTTQDPLCGVCAGTDKTSLASFPITVQPRCPMCAKSQTNNSKPIAWCGRFVKQAHLWVSPEKRPELPHSFILSPNLVESLHARKQRSSSTMYVTVCLVEVQSGPWSSSSILSTHALKRKDHHQEAGLGSEARTNKPGRS